MIAGQRSRYRGHYSYIQAVEYPVLKILEFSFFCSDLLRVYLTFAARKLPPLVSTATSQRVRPIRP